MFPWNIEDLGRIVVGRPLLPVFQEMAQQQMGQKVSRATLEKLRAGETNFYPKTVDRFNLAFPIEMIRSDPFQKIEDTQRVYGQFFDTISKLMQHFAQDARAEPTTIFHQSLRELFEDTMGAILWVENFWVSFCERGGSIKMNDPDGPTASFPLGIMSNMPKAYGDDEKRFRIGLLLEHHVFMLYFAAIEEDLFKIKDKAIFSIPSPSLFSPIKENGIVHCPMWSFWRWFRSRAGCETWSELAERADFNKCDSLDGAEGEQVVRNWANAKPKPNELNAANCKMISWKRLRQALAKVEGSSDPWSPFQLEIQWGYGIARILQEHAARCLPTVLDFCSPEFPLESFYQERIELCKQNEYRRIPALVAQL